MLLIDKPRVHWIGRELLQLSIARKRAPASECMRGTFTLIRLLLNSAGDTRFGSFMTIDADLSTVRMESSMVSTRASRDAMVRTPRSHGHEDWGDGTNLTFVLVQNIRSVSGVLVSCGTWLDRATMVEDRKAQKRSELPEHVQIRDPRSKRHKHEEKLNTIKPYKGERKGLVHHLPLYLCVSQHACLPPYQLCTAVFQ